MNSLLFAKLCKESYTAIPDIEHDASRIILRDTPYGRCAAVRGTDNVETVCTDLEALPWEVPGLGLVHLGFWEAVVGVFEKIEVIQPPVITGHSLGGAIALLMAARLAYLGKPPALVVTFGAPKISIGDRVKDILSDIQVLQYRNGCDIIPEVPLGFDHPTELIQIGTPGEAIEDHAIDRYISALSN